MNSSSTARQNAPDVEALLSQCVIVDLETGPSNEIHKIGALYQGREFRREGKFSLTHALGALDAFADGAKFVLGHNLLGHDIPVLLSAEPRSSVACLPVIDTLYLSPLAFPKNPYHRLVKNYQLVRDSIADPVADCKLARQIFVEQHAEFLRDSSAAGNDALAVYEECFSGADLGAVVGSGMAAFFASMRGENAPPVNVEAHLLSQWKTKACGRAAQAALGPYIQDPSLRVALAYVAAWLSVADGNSVLPPWVRHRFPKTQELIFALREVTCGQTDCDYCRRAHNTEAHLQRWFQFDSFRGSPKAEDGSSLQRAIVQAGLRGEPLLAMLATGGGKSLCFQLPALVRYTRRGALTVVVSPLQALMKDQVDGLARRTATTHAAAIYGLLTPPERADVMERTRLGDIAILYISPEQLRNRSVQSLLESREIGGWVFDEAHCLSKWGHDFRPDYLYAGRFIRELARRQGTEAPPVSCVTATAKKDVASEIVQYFKTELGQSLLTFNGGVDRDNLEFEVIVAGQQQKLGLICKILQHHLSSADAPVGAAVIYACSRRRTEQIAQQLQHEGWAARAFHAGIPPAEKRQVQDNFIGGLLSVICATNAFGMGVDKQDVRVVIHADIPGSLENYIQEAGRAGRDQASASCVLLYEESDIEKQFGLDALSELRHRDIVEILRGIRRKAKQNRGGQDSERRAVVTSAELLRDEALQVSFGAEAHNADTRVRIAIAWLERAQLVRRDENSTQIFQGKPAVDSLEQARTKIDGLGLSRAQGERWMSLLAVMLRAGKDESFSADELAQDIEPATARTQAEQWDRGATPALRVMRTLHDMTNAGLLREGPQLTAFVQHKVRGASLSVLKKVSSLKHAMLAALQQEAPDAEGGAWVSLSVPRLNQRLLDSEHASHPETLRTLLKSLSLDGRGMAASRGSIDLVQTSRDIYRVRLQRTWSHLLATAEMRRAVASRVLEAIMMRLPKDAPAGSGLLVPFAMEDLTRALKADLVISGQLRDPLAAAERGLMFLHEHNAIMLHGGFAIFRSAMTLQVPPEAKRRSYSHAQHQPLAHHYQERKFQIHVMDEYAKLGAAKIRDGMRFVADYFSLDKDAFARRFFSDRVEQVTRATTAGSFQKIVDDLGNRSQIDIVAGPEDGNRLVLAGPGSGKTKVVVHRCAYLLRVLRIPGHQIVVLCFNRSAAVELRCRLRALVGDDFRGVTIQTYHGFAMRLTGHSYSESKSSEEIDFDGLLAEAVDLLEGRTEIPGLDPDGNRAQLLSGYRHILVDEYQDIDESQYRLVSAIAKSQTDGEPLTILAVGDDDQNIYKFRGASVDYIRRFRSEYQAEPHYLVENYRSTKSIIDAANALILNNKNRMKAEFPIRVNDARRQAPAGDLVTVLNIPYPGAQAASLVQRAKMLVGRDARKWSEVAILAPSHALLEPVRAICEEEGIAVRWSDELPPLHRIREIDAFLEALRLRGQALLAPRDVEGLLTTAECVWRDILRRVVADWIAEVGTSRVPATEIRQFCFDALSEMRRGPTSIEGVFLGTLHGAKGLEFDHVLISDGGWAHKDAREEERRLFYVGMTRARRTLTLARDLRSYHPHIQSLKSIRLNYVVPEVSPVPNRVLRRRFTRLSLSDVDMGYGGRHRPDALVHHSQRALKPGDRLGWLEADDRFYLTDGGGNRVGKLSQAGSKTWCAKREQIEEIRLLGMLVGTRARVDAEYLHLFKADRWEIPIVEICWTECPPVSG